jgi:DNA repair protein RecN (Recombination protein N)
MLTDISIRNVAIIPELHLAIPKGLTVLTGETGAGKSIIIDAVSLLLGGRASADLIRSGADEATVEAIFILPNDGRVRKMLDEAGIEVDGELLVKRIVSRTGRNRVFLNGSMATLALLTEVAGELVNIYGQHEAQTLLRPDNHLELLDGFAGHQALCDRYRLLYDEHRTVSARLAALREGEMQLARERELLGYQVREIAEAGLSQAEDEALAAERDILRHSEKLFASSRGAYELLSGGEPAAAPLLAEAVARVREMAAIDRSVSDLVELLDGVRIQLDDAAHTLLGYSERVEADPARLQAIQDRLDLINSLARKYGPTLAQVLERRDEMERQLQRLEQQSADAGDLTLRLNTLAKELAAVGGELSGARRAAAARLKDAMEKQLHQLAMPHAQFEAAFRDLAEPGPAGFERGEFLFSPNPGEPLRPLARIASGGELSRLMLALKQLHPESDVPTLIFDEVDAGIGGATAAVVGEKLRRVASGQQVLCITHMPQVAAHAHSHLMVSKEIASGRTVTIVTPLEGEDRVQEMARMLGGKTITDTTIDHAREMISHATGC